MLTKIEPLFKLIVLTIILLNFLSCSKESSNTNELNYKIVEKNGIKTFKNKNKASDKTFDFKMKKLFTIEGYDETIEDTLRTFTLPASMEIDEEGSIYILDPRYASIKKFDKTGKYLKSFGRNGTGPGEMQFPNSLSILGDTIYVSNPPARKMVKFSLNGEFYSDLLIKNTSTAQILRTVGNDKFIGFIPKFQQTDKGLEIDFDLQLVDRTFLLISNIRKFHILLDPQNMNLLDFLTPYAVGKKHIFVANNSEDIYKVDAIDLNGNLKYSFTKNYIKQKMTKKELDNLNVMMKAINGENQPSSKISYKKAINGMYYDDKNDLVFVNSSISRNEKNTDDFIFDVFKDGIFINTIKLDFLRGADYYDIDQQIFFKNGFIYVLSIQGAKVNVYSYN